MTTEDIAVKLQETADRSLRNEGRIKKLEQDQKALLDLTASVRELANEQGNLKDDIGEIKADVKALTGASGKRWDALVDKLLFAAAGAVIAWIVAGMPGM